VTRRFSARLSGARPVPPRQKLPCRAGAAAGRRPRRGAAPAPGGDRL